MSVSKTIETLLMADRMKDANDVSSKLKVSPKRFMHLQVKVFGKTHRWEDLQKLSKSSKIPPIGWYPFIEVCLAEGNTTEAARYVKKLPEVHLQLEWLCNSGLWSDAVDVAFDDKNMDALETIVGACGDDGVKIMAMDRIKQLKAK